MKKISLSFLLVFCMLFSACSNQNSNRDNAVRNDTDFSSASTDLTETEETYPHPNSFTAPVRTVDEYLDNCKAAVKVEIVDTVELYELNVYYTCRVIEDYFGNLNYFGMEEGYINVYDSIIKYEPGDIAYMFLKAEDITSYPHIVYLQLSYKNGYVRTKYEDGKFVSIYPLESAVSPDNLYAFDETQLAAKSSSTDQAQLLEEEIKSYSLRRTKKLVCAPPVDSYAAMAEQAAEAWLIKIDSIVKDVDYGKFAKGFDCEILEVYRTNSDAEPGIHSREIVLLENEIESGKTYLFFKGWHEDGFIDVTSRDFCLLPSDSEEFPDISAIVSDEMY